MNFSKFLVVVALLSSQNPSFAQGITKETSDLLSAARAGNLPLLTSSIKSGKADINFDDDINSLIDSPLRAAVRFCHYDAAKIIIEAGADKNKVFRYTPDFDYEAFNAKKYKKVEMYEAGNLAGQQGGLNTSIYRSAIDPADSYMSIRTTAPDKNGTEVKTFKVEMDAADIDDAAKTLMNLNSGKEYIVKKVIAEPGVKRFTPLDLAESLVLRGNHKYKAKNIRAEECQKIVQLLKATRAKHAEDLTSSVPAESIAENVSIKIIPSNDGYSLSIKPNITEAKAANVK